MSMQSVESAVVDVAVLAAVAFLGVKHVSDATVWMVMSAIVGGRFGVSVGKSIASKAIAGQATTTASDDKATSTPTTPPSP